MAFQYVLDANSGDSHQVSPYWLALIVPFRYRVTADRARALSESADYVQDISFADMTDPMAEGPKLLLEHEIVQWQVMHAKANPQGVMSLTLANTGVDWRMKVVGGDWVLFWAFDNRQDYLRIRQILRKVKDGTEPMPRDISNACNKFNDGLKFVGRINGVRRTRRRNGGTGTISSTYALTCVSFKEMNFTIHFNPAFRGKYGGNDLQFQADFSGLNDFVLSGAQGRIQSAKAITSLMNICLGRGPGAAWGFGLRPQSPDEDQIATSSPNSGVRVAIPTTVGAILNGNGSGLEYNFIDILHGVVGVQSYSQQGAVDPGVGFTPQVPEGNFLEGEFLPQTLDFNQRPVWSILQTYLNEPINEMYTTLRVGIDGYVRPTVVARQIPFSSRMMDAKNTHANDGVETVVTALLPGRSIYRNISRSIERPTYQTPFLDIPRWVISPRLVESEDLGTSDSLRFNYIHCPPHDITAAGSSQFMNDNAMYVMAPPFIDKKDIQRHGLSLYTRPVNAHLRVSDEKAVGSSSAGYWTRLMTDFIITQNLRVSGTLRLAGIQQPICVGDNTEYDGFVYHIEQVVHSGSVLGIGQRSFTTDIQMSNGISLASDDVGNSGDNVYIVNDDPTFTKQTLQHEEAKNKAPDDASAIGYRVFDGVTVEYNED